MTNLHELVDLKELNGIIFVRELTKFCQKHDVNGDQVRIDMDPRGYVVLSTQKEKASA